MPLEGDLKKETEKWIQKVESLNIEFLNQSGKDALAHIMAYLSDAKHFLEKGDFILAFEAVIWAWAYTEIFREIGDLKY
jgi:hypothetical protein